MRHLTPYLTPRLLAILALGFASGLPLALSGATLSRWLSETGVDKTTIGLFAAIGTPYALKFLWAPLIDNINLPVLTRLFGRRRGWLFFIQALLAGAIIMLGAADPLASLAATAMLAFSVAALSATQDIIIDAYRVELLPTEDQARGAAMITFGYRVGMLASSAGALYLAEYYGWGICYIVMAALLAIGAVAAWFAGEPESSRMVEREMQETRGIKAWLTRALIAPFRDFTRHRGWLVILLFILLYKFGDAFLGVMTMPFLTEIGFSKVDIANIGKLFGFVATVIGGFAGAWMAERLGLMKSLWIGGVLNGVSNLAFLWLAEVGPDLRVYAVVNTIENFTGAMSGAVLVAYLSSLCNIRYTATQYALLSSLAAVGRTLLSTSAGATAQAVGWNAFFLASAVLTLPGLIALFVLTRYAKRP